ncbi:MAG: hypothetical protein IK031_02600, partial [Bacteroidales bacterium]|nr:hypothetical protein [Bacteroidales bacterium]
MVLVSCGTSGTVFRQTLERDYGVVRYQQSHVMKVDEEGDALLIRQLDTIPIKIFGYLFHQSLPQAVSDRERQAADKDFRIGKTNPLDNDLLLNQFGEVIRRHYPDIQPIMGEEHMWSPDAKKYMRYGYWHRLGRRLSGKQEDFPCPLFMHSKLLLCLACGWTSRYCVTGTEEALVERILSYPDHSLQLQQLFEDSYVLNGGDIYMALLTCENVLTGQPHRTGRADDPMQRKLAYIRNDSKPLGD